MVVRKEVVQAIVQPHAVICRMDSCLQRSADPVVSLQLSVTPFFISEKLFHIHSSKLPLFLFFYLYNISYKVLQKIETHLLKQKTSKYCPNFNTSAVWVLHTLRFDVMARGRQVWQVC